MHELELSACQKHGIKVLTRVVDYGGVFHGDLGGNHVFKPGDHRTYRPAGWVEHGWAKIEKMKPIAENTASASSNSPVCGISPSPPWRA